MPRCRTMAFAEFIYQYQIYFIKLFVDIHKKPMENNLLVDESCCQKISIIRSTFVYPMIILYTPTFHVYRLQWCDAWGP